MWPLRIRNLISEYLNTIPRIKYKWDMLDERGLTMPSSPCPFSLSAPLRARHSKSMVLPHHQDGLTENPNPLLARDIKASGLNLPLRGRGRTMWSMICHPSHFWGEEGEAGKDILPSRRLSLASGWTLCCQVLATEGLHIFPPIVTTCSEHSTSHTR